MCGAAPAVDVTFQQNIGMVFARQQKSWRGFACRDCGRSIGRRLQANTLTTGWWGLISFFTNFGAVAGNATSLRRLAALPSATPRPVNAPGPGRTVFLRPLTYVACT